MLNKVPEVALAFWVIKIMATTVGETGADLLSQARAYGGLGLGTITTSIAFLRVIVALVGLPSAGHLQAVPGGPARDQGPGRSQRLTAQAWIGDWYVRLPAGPIIRSVWSS